MRRIVACIALLGLAACGNAAQNVEEARTASVNIQTVDIDGNPVKCIPWEPLNMLSHNSNELKGDLRTRFLTPGAEKAGLRVFTSSSEVSGYGSTVVYYTSPDTTCLFFAETLGMQEYTGKAGLNPVAVTTGYAAVGAPVPAPPAPVPSPAPAPSPTSAAG